MSIDVIGTLELKTARSKAAPALRSRALWMAPLTAIVALAAILRFWNLEALGYANHYYTAAVESMLRSWHNFFFVAAEPGGSVSVDKPPVGLWLQAISAHFFGVNAFGLLLPEILAGLISVVLIFYLVRRSFGIVAGLLSALALAITPVVVATDRNNTMDSTLILTLLLAAWAFIVATERGRLRYLLLGAALVGIGFNIKMLEAYLPLPAFFALYLLGSREGFWRKMSNLTLASVVLVAISLSWAITVDLTPASQRPYVGSSGNNSVISLAFGYNGIERLVGMGGRGGLLAGILGGTNQSGGFTGGAPPRGQAPGAGGTFRQPGPDGNGAFPQRGQGAFGGFGGGFPGTGRPGLLRLFTAPLSNEVSWLLPFGIVSAGLLVVRNRLRWPLDQKHQALVLWGGWLLTAGVFFSIAGFFHEYYLSMLGAPLAALVGIGAVEMWRLGQRHFWMAAVLLVAAAGGTLWLQMATARAFTSAVWWLPVAVALLAIGAALLAAAARQGWRRIAIAGFSCVMAAMMVTPGIWSGLTALNSSANQSLPAAYSGRPSGPPNRGRLQVNQALLDYLQANTQGVKYLMAVPSSMQGADYVIATGRPVLYLGGFMGQDQVVTGADLSRMVADGELRYIYWSGNGRGGFGGQSDISSWVAANCTPVQGFDTQTRNSGAPDGTAPGANNGGTGFPGFGGMQVTLYQCGPGAGN